MVTLTNLALFLKQITHILNQLASMTRQITLVLVIFFTTINVARAQDPIFSQFYAAPIMVNPAFAGTTIAPHVALNYRNQWPSLNAYQTYSASVDRFFKEMNSGLGLMLLSDDAGQGLIKTNKISGVYSYNLKVFDDLFLRLGVEGSVVNARYDWDSFIFLDQIDPEAGHISPGGTPYPTDEVRPEKLSTTYFDVSSGLLVFSKRFYGGISLKHMNTPNETLLGINDNLNTGLPMRFTLHGGAEIEMQKGNKGKPSTFISPNVMFVRQGDFGQLNIGTYINLGYVFGGVWYRNAMTNGDAVIFLAGVRKGPLKIGYSYDVTVSALGNVPGGTGGSHELSVILNFEKPKSVNYNDCFGMFR